MALSKLLQNQTIMIDDHNRGGNVLEWGSNLHIHKRINKGSKSSLDCEIYFAAKDKPVVFSNEKGKDVDKIKNEIEEAFYCPFIRKRFILSFFDAIQPILGNDGRSQSDISRIARRAVKRIATAFGLPDDIKDSMVKDIPNFYMYRTDNYYIGLKYDKLRFYASDSKDSIIEILNPKETEL